MATAPDLVTLSNGEILARGVYDAYLKLRAAGAAAGHNVYVSSGYRTPATQIKIFTDRYDQRSSGTGSFNDVRWWNGDAYGYPGIDRWVRVSNLGTVAVPGTSMHEKASAVDFGGIPAKGGTAYANWMRANAPRFGFQPTGYGFGEAWHYDFVGNPWAGSGTPLPPNKEDDMPLDQDADYHAFKTMLWRALKWDVRPEGANADWKLGPTLWERLTQIEAAAKEPLTDEQITKIADKVIASIKVPAPELDYAALAKAVNDDAARRLAE